VKIIEWKDLYLTDYNLSRLAAMDQHWPNGREFLMLSKPRPTSALLYLKDSRVEYVTEAGESLSFPKGTLLYIPQNSRYRCRFYACGGPKAVTQLIEFELRDGEGTAFACSGEILSLIDDAAGTFSDTFAEAILCCSRFSFSYGAFKALLYSLLTRIAMHHQMETLYSRDFFPIAPAIRHLLTNPCGDTDVAALAGMCHVSESCFRSLFKRYSGKTPSKYCLDNRIFRAKQLLESGLYSVSEVAELVGYRDPGYFSKVFKKETGVLPGIYSREV